VNVRKAIAFATDRQTIVTQLFGGVKADIKPIDGFVTPANTQWYTTEFAQYKKDQTQVDKLMTASGWAKGSDGIWAKNGQKASITVRTTAGNKRRELTQQLLADQWKQAGFILDASGNQKSGTLFGQSLPAGDFQAGIYAQVPASTDPGVCTIFCSVNIPTAANNNTGNNWTRTKDPKVDSAWDALDKELSDSKRQSLNSDGAKALADYVPGLPLDPLPQVIVYNNKMIGGTVKSNFVFGPFATANEWYLKG